MEITRDMIKRHTVFHCNTEDKANELLGKLDELGCKWASVRSYLSHNNYNSYKEDTCYYPYQGTLDRISYYKGRNYKIIEYVLDKDSKEFTMDDIKEGNLVRLRNGRILLCTCKEEGKMFFDENCIYFASDYNDNLEYISTYHKYKERDKERDKEFDREYDIVKIYDIPVRNLLWERKE